VTTLPIVFTPGVHQLWRAGSLCRRSETRQLWQNCFKYYGWVTPEL